MKKALFYLFIFALVQFTFAWIVYFIWFFASGKDLDFIMTTFSGDNAQAITAPMLITSSAVTSVVLIALFVWRRWAVMSPNYLRTHPWGVFFWGTVTALGTLIPSMWLQEQMPQLPDMMTDTFEMIMNNDYGYFVLCLFAPFVEEMVFRGAILRTLLNTMSHHWVAILISAVIFAVIHINPAQMPHALLFGLLLGWMYYRTGSILPGVVMHWVNNTVAYAVYVLLPQSSDMTLTQLFGGDTTRVVLAIVFSLFILLPGIYQLNLRMKTARK